MSLEGQSISANDRLQWRFTVIMVFYFAIILVVPWLMPSDAGLFFAPASSIAATIIIALSIGLLQYRYLNWSLVDPKLWAILLALYELVENLWAASPRESLQVNVVQISALLLFVLIQSQCKHFAKFFVLIFTISGIAVYVYGMGAGVHWWNAIDAVYGTNQLASIFQYHNTFGAFELAVGIIGLMGGLQWNKWWLNSIGIFAFIMSINAVVASYSRTVWVLAVIALIITFVVRALIEKMLWSQLLAGLGLVTGGLTALLTLRALDQTNAISFVLSFAIGVLMSIAIAYTHHWLSSHSISRKISVSVLGISMLIVMTILYKFRAHLFHGATSITSRLDTINFHSVSLQERFYYYQNALHMWLSNPVFGSGGGTWTTKFQAFQTLPYWSEQVHSSFFDLLLNGGLFGLILVVVFAAFTIRRVHRNYKSHESKAHKLFVSGSALATLILLAHSLLDFDFAFGYYQYIFVILLAFAAGPSSLFSVTSDGKGSIKSPQPKKNVGSTSYTVRFSMNLTLLVIGCITILAGLSLSVSQILTNMASNPNTSASSKFGLTLSAASWAPYDGQLQLALANYYLQTAQSSRDTSLFTQAWNAAQAAHGLSPWDPTVQTQVAIIAYQLRQMPSAIAWADLSLTDAPFSETVYRNLLGLTLWTSAQELKADPSQGRAGLSRVLHLYQEYQDKMKVLNMHLFPDSIPMQMDASIQVYVATADALLHHPKASLHAMNPLLTVNRDQAAVNLYEIDTVLDDQQLKKTGALDSNMLKQLHGNPTALQEYEFLQTLV